MKLTIKELKENEPFKMVEVSYHDEDYAYPINPFEDLPPKIVNEEDMIQMRVFTDGEIKNETDIVQEPIEDYYIGDEKYKYDVDTLKTKDIYLDNYSYILVFTIAEEFLTLGRLKGWFKVVKDTTIYLKDRKDKKALKNAKKAVGEINRHNRSVDYSSIFSMINTQGMPLNNYDTKRISNNVYCLKKIK